jgi:hypothetical protein
MMLWVRMAKAPRFCVELLLKDSPQSHEGHEESQRTAAMSPRPILMMIARAKPARENIFFVSFVALW